MLLFSAYPVMAPAKTLAAAVRCLFIYFLMTLLPHKSTQDLIPELLFVEVLKERYNMFNRTGQATKQRVQCKIYLVTWYLKSQLHA
jgi:hypothetical protein